MNFLRYLINIKEWIPQEDDEFLDKNNFHEHECHANQPEIAKGSRGCSLFLESPPSENKKRKEYQYKSDEYGLDMEKEHQVFSLKKYDPCRVFRSYGT